MIEDEVCPECSALVNDLSKHSKWHRQLRRSAREALPLPPPAIPEGRVDINLVGPTGDTKT